jgi:predicted hotdog family 3-hydroxylacyl-ACP dehydratase
MGFGQINAKKKLQGTGGFVQYEYVLKQDARLWTLIVLRYKNKSVNQLSNLQRL